MAINPAYTTVISFKISKWSSFTFAKMTRAKNEASISSNAILCHGYVILIAADIVVRLFAFPANT